MKIVRIGKGFTGEHSPEVIGSKAANLARMAAIGLPVPPAFVLPISLCGEILQGDSRARASLAEGLTEGIAFLEEQTGKSFGDARRPLLVSVRSGAARSMPGMLETVLNVGCTPQAVRGLLRMTGHQHFAGDCRCRFLECFGSVVLGLDPADFTRRLDAMVRAENVDNAQSLDSEALERLAVSYQQAIEDEHHRLADDPMAQLRSAAEAVYRSWGSDRAATYRQVQHLDDLRGTAVTVQAMVFGNSGRTSGAGVAFSRNPSTGTAEPVIDVLFDSQGEDVVSGRRNPDTEEILTRRLPQVAAQLRKVLTRLEQEFGDVQDIEFTIENGKLWVLQARSVKRTPLAALRFAIDFVKEGRIDPAEALRWLDGVELDKLSSRRLADAGTAQAHGTSASAGIAIGRAAFDSQSAARLAASGEPVILMRPDTDTADIAGFTASEGIVTVVGGRTSHAALVARQLGKPCIVGCGELSIDAAQGSAQIRNGAIKEGDWLSIDGEAGTVYLGRGKIVEERPESELAEIARWQAMVTETAPMPSA